MGLLSLSGPRAQEDEPRRLTVPELARYIRRGCSCSVCEFARAEIRGRRREEFETMETEG